MPDTPVCSSRRALSNDVRLSSERRVLDGLPSCTTTETISLVTLPSICDAYRRGLLKIFPLAEKCSIHQLVALKELFRMMSESAPNDEFLMSFHQAPLLRGTSSAAEGLSHGVRCIAPLERDLSKYPNAPELRTDHLDLSCSCMPRNR